MIKSTTRGIVPRPLLMGLAVFLSLVPPMTGPGVAAEPVAPSSKPYQDLTGTVFTPVPQDPYATPRVEEIPIPEFAGANAIWGATGRDHRGHIWFGVSAQGGDRSARLFEYDPNNGEVFDRGDVVGRLREAGVYKPGEGQVKIHSKIIQAADGYLYFSSTDEEGEKPDGSRPPKWGSHLWRVNPENSQWEHVLAVPEGLTAVNGNGRWIYALGLWGHVLYRYDTRSGDVRRVEVGSVGGHMSRNFIVDRQGHAYAPRLRRLGEAEAANRPWTAPRLVVTLVQFDTDLGEVGETPLEHYAEPEKPGRSHGIISFTDLTDGSVVFATHMGALYRITPRNGRPSAVEFIGWFDPFDRAYAPSLFTFGGARFVVGLVRNRRDRSRFFQWVVYDLKAGGSKAVDFPYTAPRLLLYGSVTRDNEGCFYVVGRRQSTQARRLRPTLLRVEVP